MTVTFRQPCSQLVASPKSDSFVAVAGKYLYLLIPNVATSEPMSHDSAIRCVAWHRDETFVATSTDSKHLYLWSHNHGNLRFHAQFLLNKVACALCFVGDRVLVADRNGDVYAFAIPKEAKEWVPMSIEKQDNGNLPKTAVKTADGVLVLGHLSTLTDIIMSPDESRIITADRDERIRASYYPATHVTAGYYMAHTEYVSRLRIACIQDKTILLSAGGDSFLCAWPVHSQNLVLKRGQTHVQCEILQFLNEERIKLGQDPRTLINVSNIIVYEQKLVITLEGVKGFLTCHISYVEKDNGILFMPEIKCLSYTKTEMPIVDAAFMKNGRLVLVMDSTLTPLLTFTPKDDSTWIPAADSDSSLSLELPLVDQICGSLYKRSELRKTFVEEEQEEDADRKKQKAQHERPTVEMDS